MLELQQVEVQQHRLIKQSQQKFQLLLQLQALLQQHLLQLHHLLTYLRLQRLQVLLADLMWL